MHVLVKSTKDQSTKQKGPNGSLLEEAGNVGNEGREIRLAHAYCTTAEPDENRALIGNGISVELQMSRSVNDRPHIVSRTKRAKTLNIYETSC